jgi:hypothetical protein
MRSLFLLLIALPICTIAQKPRTYQVVTTDLATKVLGAPLTKKPDLLAIAAFTPTSSSQGVSRQFGEYFAETMTGLLGNSPDKLKLYERTKLDAVLKEQEFSLSDLTKPAAAIKLGQLITIDVLLSGTYTKLKSYIDVSARLIDISTGEVLVSYTGRVKMNKNLAILFTNTNTNTTVNNQVTTPSDVNITIYNEVDKGTARSKADVCEAKVESFRTRLHDLSTQEKIKAVVDEAVKTPFDNECGKLHYDVMYSFEKFSIDDPAYHRFILQTLDTIAYPDGDDRAAEMARFLGADKKIDNNEWKVGLKTIAKIGNYWLSNYVGYMFKYAEANDSLVAQSRIREYFSLASASKIGLPRPISYEMAFFEMMDGVSPHPTLGQYVYKTFSPALSLDDKSKSTLFTQLESLYKHESSPTRKTTLIHWMADFINQQVYTKAHEQLYGFTRNFEVTGNATRDSEVKKNFPESDLQLLATRCKEKFSTYAMATPYPSQQEDRINFCVKYRIPISGVIPTMKEADQVLKGKIVKEQLKVLKLLVQMDESPKELENSLIAFLDHRSIEEKEELSEAQMLALKVLGNIRSGHSKTISYMINALPQYDNASYAAEESLVRIGKPAVMPLINRLDKSNEQEGGLQYRLISILGRIGKDAQTAEKSIRRVLAATRNEDIRYAAEAALQNIITN